MSANSPYAAIHTDKDGRTCAERLLMNYLKEMDHISSLWKVTASLHLICIKFNFLGTFAPRSVRTQFRELACMVVPREPVSASGRFPGWKNSGAANSDFTNVNDRIMEDAVIQAVFVVCRRFRDNEDGM